MLLRLPLLNEKPTMAARGRMIFLFLRRRFPLISYQDPLPTPRSSSARVNPALCVVEALELTFVRICKAAQMLLMSAAK